MLRNSKDSKTALFVLTVCIAISAPVIPALLIIASYDYFGKVNDLPEFYAAAKMVLAGKGSLVYNVSKLVEVEQELFPQLAGRGIALYIPPFALPLLIPLALVPPQVIVQFWLTAATTVLLASLFMLKKYFALSWKGFLWLFASVSLSGPTYESLRIGQLSPFLLLAFCLALLFLKTGKLKLSALAFSFLLLKPQELLPFLVYLLGAKRYRLVAFITILGIGYAAIAYWQIGLTGYLSYFKLLGDSLANTIWMQSELSPTVRGQLLRLPNVPATFVSFVSLAIWLFGLVFIFMLGSKMSRASQWLVTGLLVAMPLGLLTTWHCHVYDLLLLIPSLIALKSCNLNKKEHLSLLLGSAGLVLFMLPLYLNVHQALLAGTLLNPQFIAFLVFALTLSALVWKNCNYFAKDLIVDLTVKEQ